MPAPVMLIVMFPVPVMPPLRVILVADGDNVRPWELSVTAPLKMLAALDVMVAMPVFPEATEIRLVCVPANPPFKVALAEPDDTRELRWQLLRSRLKRALG